MQLEVGLVELVVASDQIMHACMDSPLYLLGCRNNTAVRLDFYCHCIFD